MTTQTLYTVGHSNRTLDDFLSLLTENEVTAIADVRSSPYSRMNPQFNRDQLKRSLQEKNIAYVFLGQELGARRDEDCCYADGVARYDLIAKTKAFIDGLKRIREGAQSHRIALMCAEKDPLTCHRTILVCRHLKDEITIAHIVTGDRLETQEEAENRLLRTLNMDDRVLFESREELLSEAYEKQGDKIAYRNVANSTPGERDE